MINYFLSENLKTKRTFIRKIMIVAPVITILLAILISGSFYKVISYNWWYLTILPGSIAIMCTLLSNTDGSMQNKGVLTLPLDLKKIWIAKVLVGVKNLSISCIIIFALISTFSLIIPIKSGYDVPIVNGFLGIVVLILTFMWQVPLIMYIGNKFKMFVTIIISLTLNSVFGVLAVKGFWYAVPFSYPARLMCPILKILPNGLMAVPESVTYSEELMSYTSIPYGIIVSFILFILITYFTAKRFEKMEAI